MKSDAASEYVAERAGTGGGYFVYWRPSRGVGGRLGFVWTLWGAKRTIKKHRRGKGPGSVAYRG